MYSHSLGDKCKYDIIYEHKVCILIVYRISVKELII